MDALIMFNTIPFFNFEKSKPIKGNDRVVAIRINKGDSVMFFSPYTYIKKNIKSIISINESIDSKIINRILKADIFDFFSI